MTHVVCEHCSAEQVWRFAERVDRSQWLRDVHEELRRSIHEGSPLEARAQLESALSNGLDPTDLALGMLQPVLREVGELWEAGAITYVSEHIATSTVHDALEHVYTVRADLRALRDDAGPELMLAPAPGNTHVLGIGMVATLLHGAGVRASAHADCQTLPVLLDRIRSVRPTTLGLSIAMPDQLEDVRTVLAALPELGSDAPVSVVVGGYPLRQGLEVPDDLGVVPIHDFDSLLVFLNGGGS